jgi:hypothetical protein
MHVHLLRVRQHVHREPDAGETRAEEREHAQGEESPSRPKLARIRFKVFRRRIVAHALCRSRDERLSLTAARARGE